MDGRIDGTDIKKTFLDSSVPAKKAKRDAPRSKIAGVCSDVTAKLKVPSPLILSPHQVRTVSSTDSPLQKAPRSFDFRFVASDDEIRQLLVARTCVEHRDVTLISHPDDLSQANLVTRLSISGDGRHTLGSGKLFEGSQPLTLVLDIRKLTSEDLPKFNDLLDPDNPCLYDKVSQQKRSLGEHVALLVVADPEQLASVGQREDVPGADFWRRINRPGNTWQFDAQSGNATAMDADEVPPVLAELSAESAMDDDNTVVIDCHLHSHWRPLLLGGPGVDKQGRIQHLPGRLELLRAGQRVIVKGANWQDLAFEQTIRQILAQQCFESNGKVCQLPDNVQFYQMPVGNDELCSLFQSLSCSLEKQGDKQDDKGLDQEQPPQNPIIINESTIREWLSPIAITPEGYAVPNSCLLEQVRAGGAVTVTSPLNEENWFRLLGSLQTIRETTGLQPRLQVAHSRRQPEALGLTENVEHPLPGRFQLPKKVSAQAAIDTVTYQQNAQASHWINQQPQTPLVIQVNEQTGFSQLFDNIHITSEQKAYFGRRQSKLQEALTAGKPVVFLGLERNPSLQQLLEPLVVGQPLLVNGQLQNYPQARVTLLWPESAKSPSSVLSLMLATGKPCPEVDLWDINASRYDIPRTVLPEEALNKLYEAFKTVPAHLCNPLPEITEGLLNNLTLAARRAQQVDQSPEFLPRHWRKAINSVITHGTRQNPSVRDFMKVVCWHLLPDKMPDAHGKPDEDQTASVDPDQLNKIINSAPQLNREFVKQNLWPLARASDPKVFKQAKLYYQSSCPEWDVEEVLDRLCALILAHTSEAQRGAMACQLQVDPAAETRQTLTIRPSGQIKRLQDALASGWQLNLASGQIRSDAIQALASDCFHIARTANSEAAGIEEIKNRLPESLQWTGSADNPLSALARDLYHGEISQRDRENRRLSRLHDRLTDSPVIFLQGETGTGKSYFSARMAKASGQAAVLSLGPSDSEQTLMKRWQWQEHADGDRSMAQQNRALMAWANTKSDKDGEYITLLLDEANLAKAGLLASLNGLWEPEPCIYVNGHPVKVSAKHRVILTGNPDHYAGRQMDPALKEKLPRAYYPRLNQAFLRDRVVEPALVNQLQRHLPDSQINTIAQSATESVMVLWQYYQELLPDHEFTPRDLTDICSWVGWYLDRARPAVGSVTPEQMHGLIGQSFRDVLGPEITETHQDALSALEIWFAARYSPNNTLSNKVYNYTLQDIQQTFRTITEKIRPDFDTSGSAVCELVQRLGQDLSRCQQAYHLGRKHDGRQATLIAGPAGRGKDVTLNLVIESVRQEVKRRGESMPEVYLLNACDCSWDRVCEAIQKAKVEGGILVISEMNLIDSQHLEGELNDILAGDAHPGFHLFATINPPEYSGRKPLSPALKGRFRHLPIRQYNPAELQTIAEKVLPESPEWTLVAKKLTEKHCLLRAYLQRKNLPLQPTSLDLQNVTRAVFRASNFNDKALHQCLAQHYRLYLMAANLSLEELPGSSALAMGKCEFNSGLCQWFNETVPDIDRPWLIRSSHLSSVDEKKHEICVNTQLDEKEARTEIIKSLAQAKWRSSGLPMKPYDSDDLLTQTLYRHWQQSWFSHKFGQTGVHADSVFSLTKEQTLTLSLSANQPYFREADRRISAWSLDGAQCWPLFWHQISDLPKHLVDDFVNETPQDMPKVREKPASALDQSSNPEPQSVYEALTIDSDKAPEKYNPEDLEKEAPLLDRMTDYGNESQQKIKDYIIFDIKDFFSGLYRWWARDIFVSAEGDIKWIEINDRHMQGAEVLIPGRLPEPDQEVTLASDQTLATFEQPSDTCRYALPGLKPDDRIVALRIKPELPFTLIRDRYSGLHTLYVAEAKANQTIQFAYVVEHGEAAKKTLAEKVRPAQSTRFDARCSEGIEAVLEKVFTGIDLQPTEVQEPLQIIKDAKNTRQRIKAIKDYCQGFSGSDMPERNKNLFQFLVTQRQGSCRHRAPVFVALCRYFEIPCRLIANNTHIFAECSMDRGQTWESVDLGGAPVEATEIRSDFQLTRRISGSGSKSKKIRDLLEGADLAQQEAMAKALGISLEELKKALETNTALSEADLTLFNMVVRLWGKKDLVGFSMGVSILESLETEESDYAEQALIGDISVRKINPMSEAVMQILSNSDEDQVSDQLKSLYLKMIVHGGADPLAWLNSIVKILNGSDLTKRSVIQFASEALKSGWLNLLPLEEYQSKKTVEHHQLLLRLESVDELKADASRCLKQWYKGSFSREKNSHIWEFQYSYFQTKKKYALLVTHSHDGVSPFLQSKIASLSLQKSWTDQPEGIPNIERMLVHDPAFEQLSSFKANHRPVIILGQPSWDDTVLDKKVEALLQRIIANSPDDLEPSDEERSLESDLKNKCTQAIQQAFSYYLYGLANSKGGYLKYCWADAVIGPYKSSNHHGAHDPSSPGELYAMMSWIRSSYEFQGSVEDAHLRRAYNASDALVLKSVELTIIAEEFLNSVNLNSIYDALKS
ncbi:AAA family ATPase [Endozoicomonas sp. 8E]|uniref:AAA family ATPase n=1 Tax=Endozoicomonas sp. 8E TaxID=3035692 RepID=UPI0029390455|nr:AAA family ATPase [Endozoicomonas sp. 8E]WOG28848.1 AAA family ATPase [Endozoicomonas sp. 8E]